MGKTVSQLLREIDSKELSEWMAYARMEPFGAVREDYRAGIISTILASAHGKKGAHFSPETFFPELEYARARPPKQSVETMKDQLVSIVKSFGGKVLKKGEKIARPAKKAKGRKDGKSR